MKKLSKIKLNLTKSIRLTLTFVLLISIFLPLTPVNAQSTYNCGAYGASPYQENCPIENDQTPLSDTGINKTLLMVLSSIAIFVGIFGIIKTVKKRKKTSTDDSTE